MNKYDDRDIIQQVKSGNAAAFAHLIAKYQNMVFSLALKLLKNAEDAEELAQDTFVKAYQKLDSYEAKAKFSTWLYKIAYNACISELRKRHIHFSSLEEQQISDEDEGRIQSYFRENKKADQEYYLNLALAQLPEDDQVLITLYYFDDQSMEEISSITGLTESNVKIRIHRARKKMHGLLHEMLKEEIYSLL